MADTVIFLTGALHGTNQTWNVPSDWTSVNHVEVISHGGSGASSNGGGDPAGGGGGGGGYARQDNISLTPGGTATYQLGVADDGPNAAGASWFNGASLAASSAGICGGNSASGTVGGAGATTTGAIGTTVRAGGNGANGGSPVGGGGGGAAGPTGVGGNAAGATGGTGDGGTVAAGADGLEYTSNPGGVQVGAGGGGNGAGSANGNGVAGGRYGAGGGGAGEDDGGGGGTGGLAQHGIIVITYTPGTVTVTPLPPSEHGLSALCVALRPLYKIIGY